MTRHVPFPAVPGDRTAALQAALEATAATGATLVLGAGVHATGGLRLPSRTRLELARGAVLRPHGDYDAYASTRVDVIAEASDRAVLVAHGAEDVAISGEGVIEAPGPAFVAGELAAMGTHVPAALRPRVLVADGCTGLSITGVTIRQSPMWTLHLVRCRGVVVEAVAIDNDRRMPNTDGVVIDSCEDVRLSRLAIATADDGVVLKTSLGADGRPAGPCRRIRVSDCRVESRSCALKIGTESHADVEDVVFEDCTVVDSNRGLGIFSRDGGRIRDVVFRRIRLDCHETPDGFWGSGEAVTVNVVDRRPGRPAGAIERVVFEDVSGTMEGAVNLVADGPAGIADVAFRHVRLAQRPGPLGSGRRYDMRPTRHDLAPAQGAEGRANAFVKDADGRVVGLVDYPDGLPALHASDVTGLVLDDVAFDRPDPLPAGWNPRALDIRTGEPRRW